MSIVPDQTDVSVYDTFDVVKELNHPLTNSAGTGGRFTYWWDETTPVVRIEPDGPIMRVSAVQNGMWVTVASLHTHHTTIETAVEVLRSVLATYTTSKGLIEQAAARQPATGLSPKTVMAAACQLVADRIAGDRSTVSFEQFGQACVSLQTGHIWPSSADAILMIANEATETVDTGWADEGPARVVQDYAAWLAPAAVEVWLGSDW